MSKWIWACGLTAVLVGCNTLDRHYDQPQRAPGVSDFSQAPPSSNPYWSQQNRVSAPAYRRPSSTVPAAQASQSGTPSWINDGPSRPAATTPPVNAYAANPPVPSSPYDMARGSTPRDYRDTSYSLRPSSVEDRSPRPTTPGLALQARPVDNPMPNLARPLLMARETQDTPAASPKPPAISPPQPALPDTLAARAPEPRTLPPTVVLEPQTLPPLAAKPLPEKPEPVAPPPAPEIKQTAHSTAVAEERPPEHLRVGMVNTKRVVLNYKVDDIGPSGVSAIDLWMTRDGRQWQKETGRSGPPYVAEVAEEGMYGFTIVARSGLGLGKEPPKSGDLPQVWVEVDLSKPVVNLTEVKHGLGVKAREITINWNATDRNLARRPVTISCSESATGPWTPLAANIDNTGTFVWNMPPTAPTKFFVRVEAVDLVGNVGFAQSTTPMLIDMSQPSVSILGVESADR